MDAAARVCGHKTRTELAKKARQYHRLHTSGKMKYELNCSFSSGQQRITDLLIIPVAKKFGTYTGGWSFFSEEELCQSSKEVVFIGITSSSTDTTSSR